METLGRAVSDGVEVFHRNGEVIDENTHTELLQSARSTALIAVQESVASSLDEVVADMAELETQVTAAGINWALLCKVFRVPGTATEAAEQASAIAASQMAGLS
jgi:hypothetical protein